jgi:hypothetical protein
VTYPLVERGLREAVRLDVVVLLLRILRRGQTVRLDLFLLGLLVLTDQPIAILRHLSVLLFHDDPRLRNDTY